MGIYDSRDTPAYGWPNPSLEYLDDQLIATWWTPAHDRAIFRLASEWLWYWPLLSSDAIVSLTPHAVLDRWRSHDPICHRKAWYNVLMEYAKARAAVLDATATIRPPRWLRCPKCGSAFLENSLPFPLASRLGPNRIDFCSPCLRDSLLSSGSEISTRDDVVEYLRKLVPLIGRVPGQNFGGGPSDIRYFSTAERLEILKELDSKPSVQRVKRLFGSWLNALVEAGLLNEGAVRRGTGVQNVARDGHLCFSLGEKTICEFLADHGIEHEKEPRYPRSTLRADFKIGDFYVEYLGLAGDLRYDEKSRRKAELGRRTGIRVLAIYPVDLLSPRRLFSKLSPALGSGSAAASDLPTLVKQPKRRSAPS